MIIDLPGTTTAAINKALVDVRESGGTVALGRVLTLVIVTDEASAEESIEAANAASFEHPCRVLVVRPRPGATESRMDAQIRVGGDAGASEAIVLNLSGELADHAGAVAVPLLLPDAPVVVWWPDRAPAVPADDPVGALAQRRITEVGWVPDPAAALAARRAGYRPGDTDLAWTRVTRWRGLLAAALDQPPFDPVAAVDVRGAADSASTDLLAGWMALKLRCPATRHIQGEPGAGVTEVVMHRHSGSVTLSRPSGSTASLIAPGQPERRIALPLRSLRDCIAEELRRLDADEVYADVLEYGMPRVHYAPAPA